ncbi:MAG: UPF0280 family protein [Candidatus Omnitrophica bacterium]|nr:UPF0280 family protein [Candidatus Omnitrophota bacterium]
MKTTLYQDRFYREWIYTRRLYECRVSVMETDLQVLTDKPLEAGFLEEKIVSFRADIEQYSIRDDLFQKNLKPIVVELTAPSIVKKMSRAARLANVGPMAAVAGAIAQGIGECLIRKGYRDVIVENGGDIFLKSRMPVRVGIFAGDSPLSGKIFLRINPQSTFHGICTSSGTVGHSLSFGTADAVVVIADNALIADAAATAVANRVSSASDCESALNFGMAIRGVRGIVIIIGRTLAARGEAVILEPNKKNNLPVSRR